MRLDASPYPSVLSFLDLPQYIAELRVFHNILFDPCSALFAVVRGLPFVASPEGLEIREALRLVELVEKVSRDPKPTWDWVSFRWSWRDILSLLCRASILLCDDITASRRA